MLLKKKMRATLGCFAVQHYSCVRLQARGPLTALRTLGSILVPRLRQREGQEVDRDVAQGIMTQVCTAAYKFGRRVQNICDTLCLTCVCGVFAAT